MKLSTKSRYAVSAMVELAQMSNHERPLALAEISSRQLLPVQYLEQLFLKLRKGGLVQSLRGQGGGYYLQRPATEITIADIISAVGEEVRATGCIEASSEGCRSKIGKCVTHNLWSGLGHIMAGYLHRITLDDVVHKRINAYGDIVSSSATESLTASFG